VTMILHLTNGDCAANDLQASGLPGLVLPWRDVLHEGPLLAGRDLARRRQLRAAFLNALGWAELGPTARWLAARDGLLAGRARFTELVLWFEPDLYDQLQVLEILNQLTPGHPADPPLSQTALVPVVGALSAEEMRAAYQARTLLPAASVALAAQAWDLLCQPDPRGLQQAASLTLPDLPAAVPALHRLLEDYPDAHGLSRSERQILSCFTEPTTPMVAFTRQDRDEPHRFMGDWCFMLHLRRLASGRHPLLQSADGQALTPEDLPLAPGPKSPHWRRPLLVASPGRAVLAGQADAIALNGIRRWVAGVALTGQPDHRR
jgi:hypothetical protein